MAASTHPASFELAGQTDSGLMLNPYNRSDEELEANLQIFEQARRAAGFSHPARILMNFPLYLADSDEEAVEEAREPFLAYLAQVDRAYRRGTESGFQELVPPAYEQVAPKVMFASEPVARPRPAAGTVARSVAARGWCRPDDRPPRPGRVAASPRPDSPICGPGEATLPCGGSHKEDRPTHPCVRVAPRRAQKSPTGLRQA
ncbi:MAG: LLM class flavin-dependent oxidoreductase [Vulcanimicrobiota bacterium]